MAVQEKISETYFIENAVVYERSLNGRMFALRIVADDRYIFCRTEIVEGEEVKTYIDGFIQIPTAQIATVFPTISAEIKVEEETDTKNT